MNDREYQGVWVFAENHGGRLARVGLELLSKARELAGRLETHVAAVLLGNKIKGLAEELQDHGADRLYLAEHPLLDVYHSERHVHVLQGLVEQYKPEILLLGATRVGLDLAPCLAARLETGLSAHCIDLDVDETGRLVQYVPAFGHMCVAKILCSERNPQLATVAPGAFPVRIGGGGKAETIRVSLDLEAQPTRVTMVDHGTVPASRAAELESAQIVIAGGAGIGSLEGWRLLEEFADALGGAVGATRPAVDEGWAASDQMIGHSGKSVQPKLYVAVGISGDMLHMIGMRRAQMAVAINSDPDAPIFREVDYGIVGDYREILPLLIRGLHSRL